MKKATRFFSAVSWLISLLLMTMLLFAFSGCSSSEDENAGQKSQQSQQEQSAPEGIPPLAVKDGKLVTGFGKPIQLQGISTHGLSWFPQYVNKDMMQQTRDDWGCNVFRLAMYTAEYNGYLTGDEQNRDALKTLIDQAVNDAEKLDLYIIIDWHILSDGNPLDNVEEAKAFFAEMSAKYKDKTHVIYEICNEPNGAATWQSVKAYAQQVIPVIRQNTDAVILVGTPNWCQYLDQAMADPLADPNGNAAACAPFHNIMYTLHFYADTHRDDLRQTLKTAADAKFPVFVSEFGICDASGNGAINEPEADLWLELMNEYQISYVMWNLSNKAESSAAIKADCTKTSGLAAEDLSPAGLWFVSRN